MRARRKYWLGGLLLVLLAVVFTWRHGARTESAEPGSGSPGWWTVDVQGARAVDPEELARHLSLPYASGVVEASGETGVRKLDTERAQPGIRLYVSGHGPEATLISLEGKVLHRWRLPFESAFPGRPVSNDTQYFRRAALLPGGDLLAIYQGGGLVRLDRSSRPVWTVAAAPYNDLWIAPAGDRIYYLNKQAVARPDIRRDEPILEDFVVVLDGDGRELWRASLLAAFERSLYRSLIHPLGPTPDIFHTNTITVLEGPEADPLGRFPTGSLLVSMREIDTVAVLDPEARTVLWAQRGPFRGQHEPSLLPSGEILLFDNRGAPDGRSRIVVVDRDRGAVATRWPPSGQTLDSSQAGTVARLPNGNLLVVESERGTALEIDEAGAVVWEFRSPHRAGVRGVLVAALFDIVRYPSPPPWAREPR